MITHERMNKIQSAVMLNVPAAKVCKSKDEYEAYRQIKSEIADIKAKGGDVYIAND